MIRFLSLVAAIIGFGVFSGSLLMKPPLECQILKFTKMDATSASPERYCGKPQAQLQEFWESLDRERQVVESKIIREEDEFTAKMMELAKQHSTRRDNAIIEEPETLRDLRLEQVNILVEQNDIRSAMRIHDLKIGLLSLGVGIAGLVLFFLTFLSGLFSSGGAPGAFTKVIRTTDAEQWLEPQAAESMVATLDVKKKVAQDRLWGLRPKICSYCGKKLPYEPAGKIESVTLLKKAPTDVANPKKIVLGTGFRALPPESIPCADCGHKNHL